MIWVSLLLTLGVAYFGINTGYYLRRSMSRAREPTSRVDPVSSSINSLTNTSPDPHCELVHYVPPTGYTGNDTLVYDFRASHPACSVPVRDQGLCSGSWAIAAVDMFSMYHCSMYGDEATLFSLNTCSAALVTRGALVRMPVPDFCSLLKWALPQKNAFHLIPASTECRRRAQTLVWTEAPLPSIGLAKLIYMGVMLPASQNS